ncbi:MAG: protein kinase [Thermodesulfobacteriota bacterium]
MESQEISFKKGVTYRKMGLFNEAVMELEKLLADESWKFRAMREISACYSELGESEQSERILLQALCAIDIPRDDRLALLAALADLYEDRGKVESALERLLLIRDLDPTFVPGIKDRIESLFTKISEASELRATQIGAGSSEESPEKDAESLAQETTLLPETDGPESKRRTPRVRISGPVEYSFDQIGWAEGYASDISTGGMFVLTHEPIPVGSVIFLRFELPEFQPDFTFEIIGQTVREEKNRLKKTGILGMGIQFVSMEESQKDRLTEIIGKIYADESEAQRLISEIRFHCDYCGRILVRPESRSGEMDKCSCGMSVPVPYPQHHPLPGNPLAGYHIAGCRIDRVVGEGSAATVYKGHHLALDIPVAIKILKTDQKRIGSHLARTFLREARIIAKLKHSNIVDVMNAGEERGHMFIVMQYVPGRSLGKAVEEKEVITVNDFIRIFMDVCNALAEAHAHSIIHRDIKPDNILLTPGGRAMLVDFGLVKDLAAYHDPSEKGMTLGTPLFISPEQARGEQSIDCRADIYSLGATMFFTLAGVPPFQAFTVMEVIRKHLKEAPRPLTAVAPHVPQSISDLVAKALKKRPENRFQTIEEVKQALARASVGVAVEQFKPLAKKLLKRRPPVF